MWVRVRVRESFEAIFWQKIQEWASHTAPIRCMCRVECLDAIIYYYTANHLMCRIVWCTYIRIEHMMYVRTDKQTCLFYVHNDLSSVSLSSANSQFAALLGFFSVVCLSVVCLSVVLPMFLWLLLCCWVECHLLSVRKLRIAFPICLSFALVNNPTINLFFASFSPSLALSLL